MNPNTNPALRKKILSVSDHIFDKLFTGNKGIEEGGLSDADQKKVDRYVIKYLETSKYVSNSFEAAIGLIQQMENAQNNKQ